MDGWTFKLTWACHLLNKYGNSNPAKRDEAQRIIDTVPWDTLGIKREVMDLGFTTMSLWGYSNYVTYLEGVYLIALSRYYELTGEEWYGERADEVAGILLKVQVKQGEIRVNTKDGVKLVWRPDHTGGFLCGYKYGGGFDYASNSWWMADIGYEVLTHRVWNAITLGTASYHRDLGEFSGTGWTNHETTLCVYAGLWHYNRTGRTPKIVSVDFSLPLFEAEVTTDTSDHGIISFDEELIRYGEISCSMTGTIYGLSWIEIIYCWTFTLSNDVTGFSPQIAGYISYYGIDGNSLKIWIDVYDSSEQLVKEWTKTPIDGVGAIGELYFTYNDFDTIDLSAGTYTLKLIVYPNCGTWGELWIGRTGQFPNFKPMCIETFGYVAKVPQAAMKTKTNGYFYIPISTQFETIRIEKWFYNSDAEGDQTGGTSPYATIDHWCNGEVNIYDISLIGSRYGMDEGEKRWDYMADCYPDRTIDIYDMAMISRNFGKSGSWYYTFLNGVKAYFNTGEQIYPDANGFVEIPEGAESFVIKRYGYPVGALVTFWG